MVFGEPPADELVRTAYAREAGDTAILYKGMSLADIAHVVGLVESKIIPAGREASSCGHCSKSILRHRWILPSIPGAVIPTPTGSPT